MCQWSPVRCKLGSSGISATVLHIPSIKPVDAAALTDAAQPFSLVVSVEEHTIHGGLGGLVAEILSELEPRRLVRIGIADTWGESAPNDFLLERHGLSPERVAERIEREWSGLIDRRPVTPAVPSSRSTKVVP